MSRRAIEILARSIYRELRDRGCQRTDVIRLATALLDQLLARDRTARSGDAQHQVEQRLAERLGRR